MTISACVAGIQKLHGLQIDFAAFQRKAYEFVDPKRVVQGCCHGFMDEGVNALIFLPQ